jgi:ArsR family transcriptional regulator
MNSDYLRVFRAFSDERRLRVLEILTHGEQCACVLLKELKISQPTLSYHMKILCRSGIVKERPVGPWKYYSIDAEGCGYAQKLLQELSFGGERVEFRLIRALSKLRRTAGIDVSGDSEYFLFDNSCACDCNRA